LKSSVRIVSSCVGSNSASASLVSRSSRRARILRFAVADFDGLKFAVADQLVEFGSTNVEISAGRLDLHESGLERRRGGHDVAPSARTPRASEIRSHTMVDPSRNGITKIFTWILCHPPLQFASQYWRRLLLSSSACFSVRRQFSGSPYLPVPQACQYFSKIPPMRSLLLPGVLPCRAVQASITTIEQVCRAVGPARRRSRLRPAPLGFLFNTYPDTSIARFMARRVDEKVSSSSTVIQGQSCWIAFSA
jgi:hypothetical protein